MRAVGTFNAIITPHDFLEHLGVSRAVAASVDREAREHLFELAVAYAKDHGEAAPAPEPPPSPHGLEMRVPRTAWHVRLGAPTKEELSTFVQLAAVALIGFDGDPTALSAAAVTALRARVAKSRTQYGERSIVDAVVGEGSPTVDDIVAALSGKPCRHPHAGCRFLDGGHCTLARPEARQIAEALVQRGVLRHRNAYDPYEYGLAL